MILKVQIFMQAFTCFLQKSIKNFFHGNIIHSQFILMKEEVKKKKLPRRKWRIIVLFVIAIFLIVLFAPPALNRIVEDKVKGQLQQLAPVATVSYSSIHADFFASSLSIKDLSIRFQPDTSDRFHYHSFTYSKADLTGINFLGVLFSKKLSVNALKLENGLVKLDQ